VIIQLLKSFKRYLINECGYRGNEKFLLAVSGGIDSVVMMHLFHCADLDFDIAHCNFHLRGDESTGDQEFVEQLAAKIKVNCYVQHFDTKAYAKNNKLSIQVAARNLRYSWFDEISIARSYNLIAVGHNRDDMVETFLFNLSRGTGIRGLRGISPKNEKIIRPLLFASRNEIFSYANEHILEWREDSSNNDTRYTRNKIRHIMIPGIEKLFPSFATHIINTSTQLEETFKLFGYAINIIKKDIWKEKAGRCSIDIEKLMKYPAPGTVLFELLRDYGCNRSMIASLLQAIENEPGKQIFTSTHTITRDRKFLLVSEKAQNIYREITINEGTEEIFKPLHLQIKTIEIRNKNYPIPCERNIAALDARKITYPLILRTWRSGDSFKPLGMKGSKKISDFLTDNKIPLPDKNSVMVLESAGKIIWVVNHRIDNSYRIKASTNKIVEIKYIKHENHE